MTTGGIPYEKLIVAVLLLLAACGGTETADSTIAADPVAETTTTEAVESSTETSDAAEGATTTTAVASTSTTASTESDAGLVSFQEAAADTAAETSARYEGTIRASVPGEGDFTIYLEGAFSEDGRIEMRMDMSEALAGLGDTEGLDLESLGDFSDVRIVYDGDTAYMRFPLFSMMGIATEWVTLPADAAADTAGVAGLSEARPSDGLAAFSDAAESIEEVGSERIRGVDTTEYLVMIDAAEFEGGEDLGVVGDEPVPLSVWIGDDDGRIYRYVLDYEDVNGAVFFSYEIYDYGANISIDVPDEDETTPFDAGFAP